MRTPWTRIKLLPLTLLLSRPTGQRQRMEPVHHLTQRLIHQLVPLDLVQVLKVARYNVHVKVGLLSPGVAWTLVHYAESAWCQFLSEGWLYECFYLAEEIAVKCKGFCEHSDEIYYMSSSINHFLNSDTQQEWIK